jgi:hypothetical protein
MTTMPIMVEYYVLQNLSALTRFQKAGFTLLAKQ